MRAQLEASKLLDGIDYKISWYEFPAAAPVAEALNATRLILVILEMHHSSLQMQMVVMHAQLRLTDMIPMQ
ncbi:hypothetical protein [Acinetobacter sp. LoGeW2-3]|uniref:hypothetical protein n=1 Tax=Acinetobacter sp. LoGeW2-3 TaxID=1808001 RepID=UPI001D182908|nr:hypothetical protein [Acinetobacter sp. LoGeW2-3]